MKGQGRRVAVTGLGVVAPCGLGKQAFWSGLLGPGLDGTGRTSVIEEWDSSPYYDSPKEARRADLSEQFAVAAATEALDQAGALTADPTRIGTIFATGVGGIHTLEEQIALRLEKGDRRVSPFLVPMMMPNAPGAAVSMRFGLQGPNETICTACAAGTHAITYAARLIAWGLADAVVTGGTEHAATPTSLAGFGNMTALTSTGTSRPFDVDRDGFVMGEGAAVLVLEEWGSAVDRGARILAEVLGGGSNADAHHITAPSPGGVGAITCMELALADADLEPGDIKQINAHGTSTPLNDAAEAAAIRSVFGADSVPVVSTKGVTGHALGAAGALEAAAVLLSIDQRLIPPTANTKVLGDDIEIDVVMGEPRPWEPGPTLSNNFGFGGHNGSLIIGPA
ncbi:MAG: beta-ketoacyl-[acyl-carrier-protein] synthase family protein [Ilumatobacter sp.]|uniref:beta-ketoacyl-[acyl-carrier-protein] synthase family protein n=1 Tax=Ilumatobacter sp. TaxID=1967498 RepID=UPI0026218E90|nr:beta-ketoacyl-[acyl-carrier-protein] synthase family protein [Ilumatobacter sp.]MDJ0771125.1 beta-ketoacyl-[acyl-carrier-protein] synthase family protein [Ilumatobacter sp.]